jgi:hypothetical protein
MPSYDESAAPKNNATRPLAETLASIGSGILGERKFMAQKVALEALDELGKRDVLDDSVETALLDIMGTAAESGIALAMRETTSEDDIAQEVIRLTDTIPEKIRDQFREFVARMAPFMIPKGIAFYDELRGGSIRAREWAAEFRLLEAASAE